VSHNATVSHNAVIDFDGLVTVYTCALYALDNTVNSECHTTQQCHTTQL